jgi:hypothetical protein
VEKESRIIIARRSMRAADRVANGRRRGAGVTATMANLMKTLGEPQSLGFPAPPPLAPPGLPSASALGPPSRRARLTRQDCLRTEEHGRVASGAWWPLCLEGRSVGKARTKTLR